MVRDESVGQDIPSQLLSMGLASKQSDSLWGITSDGIIHRNCSRKGFRTPEHSTEIVLSLLWYTTLKLVNLNELNQLHINLVVGVCFPNRYELFS